MRTTIDVPADLHEQVRSIARDSNQTLSETATMLMRRGLGEHRESRISRDPVTGLAVLTLGTGRTITSEDVRALDDDE